MSELVSVSVFLVIFNKNSRIESVLIAGKLRDGYRQVGHFAYCNNKLKRLDNHRDCPRALHLAMLHCARDAFQKHKSTRAN